MQNRRRFERFQLRVPASFCWRSATDEEQRNQGMTRDLSTHGVFITCVGVPKGAVSVDVELSLPSPVGMQRRIKLRGQVLRMELSSSDREYGFAVYSSKQVSLVTVSELNGKGK